MKKLSLREVKQPFQGHSAGRWWIGTWTQGSLPPKSLNNATHPLLSQRRTHKTPYTYKTAPAKWQTYTMIVHVLSAVGKALALWDGTFRKRLHRNGGARARPWRRGRTWLDEVDGIHASMHHALIHSMTTRMPPQCRAFQAVNTVGTQPWGWECPGTKGIPGWLVWRTEVRKDGCQGRTGR